MKFQISSKHARLVLMGATAAAAFATAASAQTAPSAGQGTTVGEVIVTAQKRATNLQTTPLAISAVSGATLKTNVIQTFEDLAHSVPASSRRLAW